MMTPSAPSPQGQGAPQPPQGAPKGPPQGGGSGPAGQIVAQIDQGLMKLMQLMDQAKGAISPQDKQNLGQIIQAFHKLIDDLSHGPGQAGPQPPQPGGPSSPMAGPKGAPANF